jgi:signal transduction histidine kinase/ActR/RegA family two-component response regulator
MDVVGRRFSEVIPGIREADPDLLATYGRVATTGRPEQFESYFPGLQAWFAISVYSPAPGHFVALFDEITGRKQAEAYRDMCREALQALNEPGALHYSIQHVLAVLKSHTGCDAVGIRLQEGDDFPYYGQEGFPEGFLATEYSLLERSANGEVCRDEAGKVNLECTCGLVLTGRAEPGSPFFTPGGSFWTNDSLPLRHLPPDLDPRFHPRSHCMNHGYASIALVPIRNKDSIIGLIQFNDHRKGCFSREAVEQLEGIASHLGAALLRKQAELEKTKLEEQLQHAQKMESVGRLAGGVAHDFNNMLSVIIGHGNLAMMQLDPSHALHANLEEILKAAERSADLTRQLLAFARKQTIAPKVLNLNDIVAGILKMMKRLIGEQISLVWNHEEELWPVKVDPSQIDQILANLCVNASDSIAELGKIILETRNCVVDEGYCACNADFVPGEYVRLSVSDTGCGMSRETQNRIFEPFFTTKDLGAGTGLGLATVYGIVKQNRGFINVYSEPGLGTTLTIYLPRYLGKTDHLHAAAALQGYPRGYETILLVEDEPAILNVVMMILVKQGYTVLPARNPGEALRLAREHADEIHLLLTDVVMPEMNGLDLAIELQQLFPHIMHLFMSGYTADIIAQNGVLDQGLQFIHKPFSLPDLAAKVREVLDSKTERQR